MPNGGNSPTEKRWANQIVKSGRLHRNRGEAAVFCHKCGVQLHAEAEFCHRCGRPVPPDPSLFPISSPPTETHTSPERADTQRTAGQDAFIFGSLYVSAGVLVFILGIGAQVNGEPETRWLLLTAQGLLFGVTGIQILSKDKSAVTLVWVTAVLGAIGMIARGLVPLDIVGEIGTVIFAIWFQRISQSHLRERAIQSKRT